MWRWISSFCYISLSTQLNGICTRSVKLFSLLFKMGRKEEWMGGGPTSPAHMPECVCMVTFVHCECAMAYAFPKNAKCKITTWKSRLVTVINVCMCMCVCLSVYLRRPKRNGGTTARQLTQWRAVVWHRLFCVCAGFRCHSRVFCFLFLFSIATKWHKISRRPWRDIAWYHKH